MFVSHRICQRVLASCITVTAAENAGATAPNPTDPVEKSMGSWSRRLLMAKRGFSIPILVMILAQKAVATGLTLNSASKQILPVCLVRFGGGFRRGVNMVTRLLSTLMLLPD